MYDCFRPGDVIRAKVLSLGDARSYHLTTADNALGVVHAKSLAGGCMVVSSLSDGQEGNRNRARCGGRQAFREDYSFPRPSSIIKHAVGP